jgi:hypothetical protein
MPSSEEYGIVGSEVCTGITALLAVIFAFYPMDTLILKILALLLIAQPCIASIALAVERRRLIGIERVARVQAENVREVRELLDSENLATIDNKLDVVLKTIVHSSKPDREKVESFNKYAVAARAFRLVDEIGAYLQNNKIPKGRFRPPVWLGTPRSEDSPEASYAARYKEHFGSRMKEIVEQLDAVGVKLPQPAQQYYQPGMYSWVPLGIEQIRQAANQLVAELIGEAGLRPLQKGDSVIITRSVRESIAKPIDSVTVTVTEDSAPKPGKKD